jgi:serine/threonine protein kinase
MERGNSSELEHGDPFDLVGHVVDGRLLVEARIARGGFGVVYRARHMHFDSIVALKVLRIPGDTAERQRRQIMRRFAREGALLFELAAVHPSIVRVLETGTLTTGDGALAPYLTMEWLEGHTLAEEARVRRLGGQRFGLSELLSLLEPAALGLAAAHDRGVVHRDIKPSNIYLTRRDGRTFVKLLDFGLAKALEGRHRALGETTAARAMTPAYAAPEQWLERLGPAGAWTDVHGLALTCVELLGGKRPLRGRSSAQLMAACLDAVHRPTPASLGVELGPTVEAVFRRALAVEPSRRYGTIKSFWDELCAAAASTSPRPAKSRGLWLHSLQLGFALLPLFFAPDSPRVAPQATSTGALDFRGTAARPHRDPEIPHPVELARGWSVAEPQTLPYPVLGHASTTSPRAPKTRPRPARLAPPVRVTEATSPALGGAKTHDPKLSTGMMESTGGDVDGDLLHHDVLTRRL